MARRREPGEEPNEYELTVKYRGRRDRQEVWLAMRITRADGGQLDRAEAADAFRYWIETGVMLSDYEFSQVEWQKGRRRGSGDETDARNFWAMLQGIPIRRMRLALVED